MSKWGMVTVGGNPAVVSGTGPTYQFDGVANLVAGSNTVQIVATATSGVSGTSTYQVTVPDGIGRSFTYDADGEMTNNGAGQRYQWDAANRLAVIWSGTVGNSPSTTFTYNGLGQRVTAVQKDANNNLVMEQQFVWYPGDVQPSEERDASGNVTKRFFSQGEQISGTDYFYERDHLGSVRELADSSGAVKARYDYDLWGRRTKLSGTMDADFGYAGYYQHLPSGLSVTMFRAYDPNLGRWLSRDPIAEAGGINLYEYCYNNPVRFTDPFGLDTYIQNRLISTSISTSQYNPISHTFVFTTNDDGTLKDTYSWGNAANPRGWNKNQPEDRCAAQQALKSGKLTKVGDSDLDPYIDSTFNSMNYFQFEHANHWIIDNCKTEANNLIQGAQQSQQSAGAPPGGWDY
jgi:RHS repeat-associated protein